MEFEKLCEKVFSLHDDIRYAGVINDGGSLLAGGMRKGLDSITEDQNDELYLAQTALRKSMRQRFDETMGRARFAYVEREKISMLTFYMDKNILGTFYRAKRRYSFCYGYCQGHHGVTRWEGKLATIRGMLPWQMLTIIIKNYQFKLGVRSLTLFTILMSGLLGKN